MKVTYLDATTDAITSLTDSNVVTVHDYRTGTIIEVHTETGSDYYLVEGMSREDVNERIQSRHR